MDTLALEKSEKNGTSFEVERKKLSTIQHQRKLARAAKLIRRKMGKNSTVKVLSTLRDEDGNVMVDEENNEIKIEHVLKCDIEDACMEENMRRFSQSNDTPPMQPYFYNEVGLLAEKPLANDILKGNFQPKPEWDRFLNNLCLHLQDSNYERNQEEFTLSLIDHIQGWKKQK